PSSQPATVGQRVGEPGPSSQVSPGSTRPLLQFGSTFPPRSGTSAHTPARSPALSSQRKPFGHIGSGVAHARSMHTPDSHAPSRGHSNGTYRSQPNAASTTPSTPARAPRARISAFRAP